MVSVSLERKSQLLYMAPEIYPQKLFLFKDSKVVRAHEVIAPNFSSREMFPDSTEADSPSSFTLHVMWKPLVIR